MAALKYKKPLIYWREAYEATAVMSFKPNFDQEYAIPGISHLWIKRTHAQSLHFCPTFHRGPPAW